MTRRAHRGMGLVVSLLLMLWLVAPVVRAQDEAPPPETAAEVAEPAATEPEAEEPAPAPPELPAAPEDTAPVATEPPATEELPVEPPPAPPPADTPVPMAEPTAAEPATGQGADEPDDTSALAVESSLTVSVVDAASAPIAGASVIVYDTSWNQVTSGTTDASGVAAIGAIAEGWYNLEVTAAGYFDAKLYSQWVSGQAELPLALQPLPPPGTLGVVVIDQQTGAPITGAAVVVSGYWSGEEVASGTTASDGTFVTPELTGGEYRVTVTADQYLEGSFYAWLHGPIEITAPLQPAPLPGALTIHLVDQFTGEPVVGASLTYWAGEEITGTSDATGTYTTVELSSGWHVVRISADNYFDKFNYLPVNGPTEVTIALEPILPGIVTVHVTDRDTGSPLANATVTVRRQGTEHDVATGTTDANGVFVTGELTGGEYWVNASAENYVGNFTSIFINGPVETSIEVTSKFPGAITVMVIDQVSGEPVAGATVTVYDYETYWLVLATGTADASGAFTSPELRGGMVRIEVRAQGYLTGGGTFWLSGPTTSTIQLAPMQAGTLTVRVVDQFSFSPIAGASVVVRDSVSGTEVAAGTSDANGVLVTRELVGGVYDIEVTTDGYVPGSGSVSVHGPAERHVYLQPRIDGVLTVSAVDGLTGQPVAGASVVVTDLDGNEVAAGPTGDGGAFSTGRLEGGLYSVTVTAANYQPAETQAFVSGDSWFSVSLQPIAGTLTIVAVDQFSGAPIPGATVMVSDFSSVVATGTTDATGAFTTGVLDPREYSVEASAEGYFWASDRPFVRGDTVFTIALEPRVEGALTVLVTDHVTGEPIHKASVKIWGESGPVTGTTDSKGMFVTGTLPGDWYRIDVLADGYDPDSGVRFFMISGPTELTVSLEPQVPGVLTITAVDQISGEPVEGATVEVRDSETWMIVDSGKTKKGGVFTTKVLPAGYYSIQVTAEGYFLQGDTPWVSGDTAVTAWMYPRVPGNLTVTTVDQVTGLPVAGAEVVVTNPLDGTQVATGATDSNGVFAAGTLAAGDYSIEVTADGYLPNRDAYTFVNGASEVTISLEPAVPGTVTVSVMDQATWQLLPGTTVTIRESWTGAVAADGVTDGSGYLVIPELPAGDYYVHAAAAGYAPTGFAWVRVNGPTSVTIWMVPGEPGTLTLSVIDERSGTPIANASVVVRDGSGAEVAAGTTDSEGILITGELPPGLYRIDLAADRYHPSIDQYASVNGANTAWLGMTLRTEATLSLSVDTGMPGTKVQVDGSGYQPGEVVTIVWQDLDGIVLTTTKAKSDGTIATSFTIPVTYPSWHRVVAIGQDSDIIGAANLTVVVPETP